MGWLQLSTKHIRLSHTFSVGSMVHLQQTNCASKALEGWSGQNKTSKAASVIDGAKLRSCANVFGAEANILSDVFTLNTEMRGSPEAWKIGWLQRFNKHIRLSHAASLSVAHLQRTSLRIRGSYMGWSGQNNTSGAASVTQSRKAELTSLANLWLRIQQLLKSLYTQHQYKGGPFGNQFVPNLSRFLTNSTFNWKKHLCIVFQKILMCSG